MPLLMHAEMAISVVIELLTLEKVPIVAARG